MDNDYDITDVTIMEQQIHADYSRPVRPGICLIYGNIYTSDERTMHAMARFSLSGMTFVAYGGYRFLITKIFPLPHPFRSYYHYRYRYQEMAF